MNRFVLLPIAVSDEKADSITGKEQPYRIVTARIDLESVGNYYQNFDGGQDLSDEDISPPFTSFITVRETDGYRVAMKFEDFDTLITKYRDWKDDQDIEKLIKSL